MIILIHGFGSNGEDSRTNNIVKTWFPDETVITPTYRYYNPDSAFMDLREQIQTAILLNPADDQLVFIGVSLGGFWARYFANEFSADKLIMLNPSLVPHKTLLDKTGPGEDHYTGSRYVMTEANVKNFSTYFVQDDLRELPITVIVADDDDIVDPKTADTYIGSFRAHIIHTTGGHRLMGTLERHRGDIEFAVYSVSGGLYID